MLSESCDQEHILNIRLAQASDEAGLIQLIAEFRVSLAQLRGKAHILDLAAAKKELGEYLEKNFPIYVAEMNVANGVSTASNPGAANEMARRVQGKGYKWVDLSLTGADNPATPGLAERMGARIYKRYRVYRREVDISRQGDFNGSQV
jgi:hypothetical protein